MTLKRKFISGTILLILLIVGITVLEISRGPHSLFAGFDRHLHAKYENVSEQHTLNLVVASLGEPSAISDSFMLPQEKGFEHLFEDAKNSSAVQYYLWVTTQDP